MATSNNVISLRRHDLDNLRTFLTGLVTVHHTSLAYGGAGGWPFRSAAFPGDSPLLLSFNMVNQSFFMGIFFWISGRVSAQSLQKTTDLGAFIKNKALRLGVPALAYTLVVNPVVRLMTLPTLDASSVRKFLGAYYTGLRGVRGPIWYTATLLSFDAVAVLIRKLRGSPENNVRRPGKVDVYEMLKRYGWLAVVIGNFLAKKRYPFGASLPIISAQPVHAFQYIYAYSLGYLSYSRDERTMKGTFDPTLASIKAEGSKNPEMQNTKATKHISLVTALMMSSLSISLIFLPRYLDTGDWFNKTAEQLFGGWNLPSFIYVAWNELSFNLIGPALMSYFDQWHNKPATSSTWNARYSYAAFLLHTPVSVAIELLVEKFMFSNVFSKSLNDNRLWQSTGPVVMTFTVGLASAWTSSFLGRKILEWIPSLKNII